jgi:hypothetical protein
MTDDLLETVNEVKDKLNDIEKQNEQIKQFFDSIKSSHVSKEDLRSYALTVVSDLRWWITGGVLISALIVGIVCISTYHAQSPPSVIAPPQVIVVPGYTMGPAGSQQTPPPLSPGQKP